MGDMGGWGDSPTIRPTEVVLEAADVGWGDDSMAMVHRRYVVLTLSLQRRYTAFISLSHCGRQFDGDCKII
jgi:hypothetical protein